MGREKVGIWSSWCILHRGVSIVKTAKITRLLWKSRCINNTVLRLFFFFEKKKRFLKIPRQENKNTSHSDFWYSTLPVYQLLPSGHWCKFSPKQAPRLQIFLCPSPIKAQKTWAEIYVCQSCFSCCWSRLHVALFLFVAYHGPLMDECFIYLYGRLWSWRQIPSGTISLLLTQ